MTIAHKRIAASRPAVITEVELYEVPASTEIPSAKLTVVNQHTSAVTFSVAHTDATGAATGEDWVRSDVELESKGWRVIHLTMGPLETVRIKAGVVDVVSFVLDGLVKT